MEYDTTKYDLVIQIKGGFLPVTIIQMDLQDIILGERRLHIEILYDFNYMILIKYSFILFYFFQM